MATEEEQESPAELDEIDSHAQAVELLGYVATECATFFEGIAQAIKSYERTGELPSLAAHAAPKPSTAGAAKGKGRGRQRKTTKDKPTKEKVSPTLACQRFCQTFRCCFRCCYFAVLRLLCHGMSPHFGWVA